MMDTRARTHAERHQCLPHTLHILRCFFALSPPLSLSLSLCVCVCVSVNCLILIVSLFLSFVFIYLFACLPFFFKGAKVGIQFFMDQHLCVNKPRDVAQLLLTTAGLNKHHIGTYLGKANKYPFQMEVVLSACMCGIISSKFAVGTPTTHGKISVFLRDFSRY